MGSAISERQHTEAPTWLADSHLACVLAHDLNHVRHGKVHDVVPPGELQDDVRSQQVVALEEASGKTLVVVVVQEPLNQVLSYLHLPRLAGIHHGVLPAETPAQPSAGTPVGGRPTTHSKASNVVHTRKSNIYWSTQ